MKRGGPLKRTPLVRGTPLRADVEKVREFMQRGRGDLGRSGLSRGAWRRPGPEDDPTPAEMLAWRREVCRLSEGACIMTGHLAQGPEDHRFEAHHVVPQRELRARWLHRYRDDPRIGVWISRDAHERHELASRRVPWTVLPARVWEACAELDAIDGTRWATDLVRRLHPYQEDHDGEGRGDGRRPARDGRRA